MEIRYPVTGDLKGREELRKRAAELGITEREPFPATAEPLSVNQFAGLTDKVARPEVGDAQYRGTGATLLERDQRRWDDAKLIADHNAKLRADKEARNQTEKAETEAARTAANTASRSAARADLEDRLKSNFMGNAAATEADWERVKDSLVARALEEAALASDRSSRRRAAAAYTG
jgi:hypothetical protein